MVRQYCNSHTTLCDLLPLLAVHSEPIITPAKHTHAYTLASAVQRVHQQLQAILVVLLSPHPQPSSHPLHQSLESLVFMLCRLPSLHSSSLLPPCLLVARKEGAISESVLDQALMESEVRKEF